MKTILYIIIYILLLGCTGNLQQEKTEQVVDMNTISDNSLKIGEPAKPKILEFDIDRFHSQADSLLKVLKDDKYSLELKSDTFNFKTDNPEIFTKGQGDFWLLYQDRSERIVRHYLFEPNTRKKLRIYLI